MFRRILAFCVIWALLSQSLIFPPGGVHALDIDGTSHLDLILMPTLPSSMIVGQEFTLDIALQNASGSEGDAYRPGFILALPTGVSLTNSHSLGSPVRTVAHASGSTLLFFQTKNDVILQGLTTHYPITLTSAPSAGVFVDRSIGVLAYADDSIYGRGAVPSGAPIGTLSGGVDWARGSGVYMPDPGDLTFPSTVSSGTILSALPFIRPNIRFTPFDVTKSESTDNLIGKPMTTTLTVHGNSMGPLRHFHLQDIIPNNRAFTRLLSSTGTNIGGLHVTYDNPSPGFTTIDITDITVPLGSSISLQYETLPLAYPIMSYSGGIPLLDTGSIIHHGDLSRNTVTMHTGSLAVSGGPYLPTTWSDGTHDILVNDSNILPPRTVDASLSFAQLKKSVDKTSAVIGDTLTYTLDLTSAKNVAFTTHGSGTYIVDRLPDGIVFSGMIQSTIVGTGSALTLASTTVDADGDTILVWRLMSGTIGADTRATITYQATIDGHYEGAGDTEYENTETLVNRASFVGTIGDGGLSGIWGETDTSLIDSQVVIHDVTATVTAPNPTTQKHLISITTPTGHVYDHTTGMPSAVPAGSQLRFAVTMEFPHVAFLAPRLIDALPLLTGPNTHAYDFAFQIDTGLQDIAGKPVAYNTENGSTPATTFNGRSLLGTTYPNASWIKATGANNLEFSLGNGIGKKTFALLFTVDILPQKPNTPSLTSGLVPLTNFAYSSFDDDTATPNPLPILDVPFAVTVPYMSATKVASGATSVEAGKNIDYTVTLTNTGTSPAYLEHIIDALPLNMDFITGSILSSGSALPVPASMVQVGTGLIIEFQTGALTGGRSLVPLDDPATTNIKENIIVIKYTLRPNTNFVIQGGATRTNTISFDYYASPTAPSDGLNNLGPVSASANVAVKYPSFTRTLFSSSEPDSDTNNLYVGEVVTYRTYITIPQGTLNLASYFESNTANFTFLSGSYIDSSGSLSFSSGYTFTGMGIPFGTIINTDTNPNTLERIVLDTTYRVQKNASPSTNNLNHGVFVYSSTAMGGQVFTHIRKPTLTLTKVATPTIGEYGTTIHYTVTVQNTSTTAHAYDIRIRDILPAKLQYITGTLVAAGFSPPASDIFLSGILLDVLPPSLTQTLSFDATPSADIHPDESLLNTLDGSYDTLDDDASLYEWTGTLAASAGFHVQDLSVTHTLSATDLADTTMTIMSGALTDVTIGERVIYETQIDIPHTTFTGFSISQTLPVGMRFVSGSILIDGIQSHSLSNVTISPENIITFSLGDVDNTGIGAGSGVTLRTEAVLYDYGANIAGTTKHSTISVSYGSKTLHAGPVSLEVVEPTLSVTKVYAPNTGDAGDIIPTTVTVSNMSDVTAYDILLTDTPAQRTIPGVGYSGTLIITSLAPGESRTYTYDTQIDTHVSAGDNLTGTASIIYTSYPGDPVEGERTYSVSDTDFINIAHSGAVEITRVSPEGARIGERVTYMIRVPLSEGETASLGVENILPTGMAIIPSSIHVTPDPHITLSGTLIPTITPESGLLMPGQTQSVIYTFTDLTNADTDNSVTEYVTITYDAVVLDRSDNNLGDTKIHTVTADYTSGMMLKQASTLPTVIVEPSLSMALSHMYTDGPNVTYTFTLTNTGTSTAYDGDITTLLPPDMLYTGSISLVSSGGVVDLQRSGDHIIFAELPPNTGHPLVFSLMARVDPATPDQTLHTLTGSLRYTSLPNSPSPSTSHPLDTERTGNGGVDDYHTQILATSFTLVLSLLDEAISVTDLNGGVSKVGDTFEYTITLTNSGSTPLTGVPVTLDIPAGFTGFTMQSIPPGSTDTSIGTGGTYGAGYLEVQGISIPVGSSRTIIYRVTALPTVPPSTTISTVATVGESIEGAIGGYPSVPVTLEAPRLISTAIETDRDGGSLYQGDSIMHHFTLTNTGTTPIDDVRVTIAWHTGALMTGSIMLQTGSSIDTGSIWIEAMSGQIHFRIPHLGVGATESIEFVTVAVGPISTVIGSEISATSPLGVSTDTLSNTLIIIDRDRPPTGGGGGGGSPLPPKPIIREDPVVPSVMNAPPVPKKKRVSTPPSTSHTGSSSLDLLYTAYLHDLERYRAIIRDESTAGILGITYPHLLPQTGRKITDRVGRLTNSRLTLDPPRFVQGSGTLDSYLPSLPARDRQRDTYIVLPSNGMITPVNTLATGSSDYTRLVNGREIDVNPYLRDGVMVYPGTQSGGYGTVGNTVIFGHSSYYASDSGRYKTHFQKIIELDPDDEIWVYQRQRDQSYRRYRYRVAQSYETLPTDVSVLAPGIGSNLTLFTCTPIGGISGRWVVRAQYIQEDKSSLETILYGSGISADDRQMIDGYFASIRTLPRDQMIASITEKYESLQSLTYSDIRQYWLYRLARAYHQAH